MGTREGQNSLLARLPDDYLSAVEWYLLAVEAGMPADIAEDDVPLSVEEDAMLAAPDAAIAPGDVVSHETLGQRLATRGERG
jgi:hypothetical protein